MFYLRFRVSDTFPSSSIALALMDFSCQQDVCVGLQRQHPASPDIPVNSHHHHSIRVYAAKQDVGLYWNCARTLHQHAHFLL